MCCGERVASLTSANSAPGCDRSTRRANHQKSVQPCSQKYLAGAVGQISDFNWRVSPVTRGVRTSRTRGGMRWTQSVCKTSARERTAKSCGPDAAVLASSSLRSKLLESDGGKRAVHRGEHEVSRKATAQGRPGCSVCTCMLVCVSSAHLHTRPRVQQAPGLPCALCFRRDKV